jgi:CRP/FNR family nitrogen fixation transcriptional regulator
MHTPRASHLHVFERAATLTRYSAGDTIYYQGASADSWYAVVSGAARQSALTPDGRRHIVSFLLPGDLFGFGSSGTHHFSAEVITQETTVASYPRVRLETLAETQPLIGRAVREAAFESIARLQMRMVLLARPSAIEKVSAFLLEMAHRSTDDDREVTLPMSRYDIADYLAVAVETVSRALTELRMSGVISVAAGRRISILNRCLLEARGGGCLFEPPSGNHSSAGWTKRISMGSRQ